MKCYIGNYDGIREGLVIAKNQKDAARISNRSVYDFREHWQEIDALIDGGRIKEETLYTKPFHSKDDELVEGQCELPERTDK